MSNESLDKSLKEQMLTGDGASTTLESDPLRLVLY